MENILQNIRDVFGQVSDSKEDVQIEDIELDDDERTVNFLVNDQPFVAEIYQSEEYDDSDRPYIAVSVDKLFIVLEVKDSNFIVLQISSSQHATIIGSALGEELSMMLTNQRIKDEESRAEDAQIDAFLDRQND